MNALGMSAVARYLGCPQHSGRLRSLALYRREGHLAWADPVAEALAAGGAPCLEVRRSWVCVVATHDAANANRLCIAQLINPTTTLPPQALHLSFFPFGSQAADAFIRHRLVLHPLR